MNKNKLYRRIMAMVLSVAMVVALLSISAAAETLPDGGEIISFKALSETTANQLVTLGTDLADLDLPDTLMATIRVAIATDADEQEQSEQEPEDSAVITSSAVQVDNSETSEQITEQSDQEKVEYKTMETNVPVTWNSNPEYDGDTVGIYIFTANAGNFKVDTVLPEITVTVQDQSSGKTTVFSALRSGATEEDKTYTTTVGTTLEMDINDLTGIADILLPSPYYNVGYSEPTDGTNTAHLHYYYEEKWHEVAYLVEGRDPAYCYYSNDDVIRFTADNAGVYTFKVLMYNDDQGNYETDHYDPRTIKVTVEDAGGSDEEAPTVESITPNGTDAAASGDIVITFSEAMDPNMAGTVSLDNSMGDLGSGDWSGEKKVYKVSYSELANETEYSITISGFKDAAGNEMTEDTSHTFTTKAAGGSSIWDGSTKKTDWYKDTDTEFSITTAEQLAGFAELVNGGKDFSGKTVKLGADITLNDVSNSSNWDDKTTGLNAWTAIGTSDNKFAGTFDGDGHKVSGIYISKDSKYQGLFGYTGSGSTVKNVGVTDSYIKSTKSFSFVGGVVGMNYNGKVNSCYNTGSVNGCRYVGGVVGKNEDYGEVHNCYNTGSITGIGSNSDYVGGVAGKNEDYGEVYNCYNTGSVSSVNKNSNVGVVVGSVGTSGYVFICHCYYDKTKCGDIAAVGDSPGDVKGYFEGKTTADMQTSTPFTEWDADAVWNFESGKYPRLKAFELPDTTVPTVGSVTPSGTDAALSGSIVITFSEAMDPNTAGTVSLDNSMGDLGSGDWSGEKKSGFILNDVSDADNWDENTEGLNSWTPIGNDKAPFCGIFDGNGHTVSGIYIHVNKYVQGLFGKIQNATVQNLGVTKSYICGNAIIGGIVAYCDEGTISKCYNEGTVRSTGASMAGSEVGGIAGCINSAKVENCYNTGNVIGSHGCIGGIVGNPINASSVVNCYNTGALNYGSLTSFIGCIVGNSGVTVTDCYYDKTICGDIGGIKGKDVEGQAKGKTTTEMKNPETFSAWSPDIWILKSGEFPMLKAPVIKPMVTMVSPSGTKVETSGNMVIIFNVEMDKASGKVSLKHGTETIELSSGKWSEDGTAYTVSYSQLDYGTEYTVKISDFKSALDGILIEEDSSHAFTTKIDESILTGTAKISGDAVFGKTLTASLTDGNSTGTLSYQWTRDGKDISGATESTYTLTKDDVGAVIAVKITSDDKTGTRTSDSTSEISKADCTETAKAPEEKEKTSDSITATEVEGYEYIIVEKGAAVSTGTWQDSNKFTGLTPAKEYDVYQRIKDTQTHKASKQSEALTVTTLNAVAYNWNYGELGTYITQSVSIGDKISAPATPERAGYTFGGWYKENACENAWNFNVNTVEKSMSLYAKWTKKSSDTLEVTYMKNGATSGKVPKGHTNYKPGDTVIVLGNVGSLSKTGASFAGWSDGTTTYKKGDTFKITDNTVLTAVWTENEVQCTVTYKSNYAGGGTYTTQTAAYGSLLTKPDTPIREGYSFIGWYKNAACTNPWNFDLDTVTDDTTLYTKWAQGTYSVSGTVTDDATPSNKVARATVKVMKGNVQYGGSVQTNDEGKFTVTGIPNGEYNIVITKNGQMVTLHITIDGADYNYKDQITLPSGNKNSRLDIIGVGTPNIVEDGLDDIFDNPDNQDIYNDNSTKALNEGGTVELRLTVQKDDNSKGKETVYAKMSSDGYKSGITLDVDIEKTVIDNTGAIAEKRQITSLDDTLTLIIPLTEELQGKSNYVVYRTHDYGGAAGVKVDKITTTPNANEYIKISADKTYLTLYAKFFSTYAIGYSVNSSGSNPDDTSSDNSSHGRSSSGGSSSGTQSYKITVTVGDGGSINPSGNVSVVKGKGKTFTFTPKEGFMISDVLIDGKSVGAVESYTFKNVNAAHTISVKFAKAELLPYYINGNGNKVFIGFASSATGTMKYIAPEGERVQFMQNSKYFNDINGHWAKTGIDFVTQREIFVGTTNNTFSPNSGMTRAMFATVIGRLYERSYGNISATVGTFSDVPDGKYYSPYVNWAEKNSIIMGIGGNKFAPNRKISREEMTAIIYRFAEYLKVSQGSLETKLGYTDASKIDNWAIESIKYCKENKIVLGRDDGSFDPQDTATRAEVATILKRFIETVVK
ncbi:InlB B-repeat-containing protein [Anaerovorax odorimutans]|uniref:InlB B-repeat-containing protein n=1 Tax=Anaerovorax odorimutans TaxID=109327 RepID=UPI0004125E50|nr:InlB B-repeat-containing protein [Anaerovorax odorimutans]